MKKLAFVLMVAVVAVASSCSKEKKITKTLWKPEGTWNIVASSYGFYSMGTYNTTTGKYEDSTAASTGDYNGCTFVFEKFSNADFEGRGTFTTPDTTVNFTYFVSEISGFSGSTSGAEYQLVLENDPPTGGTSEQEFYEIMSHDKTKMSLSKISNSGWSTTPYEITHSYITIDMQKP